MRYAIEVSYAGVPGAETFEFDGLPIRIGRSDLNELVLDVPFVSQCHGVVRDAEGTPVYTDLGSTNPTLLGGQPLPRRGTVPLAAGAILTVAQVNLKWVSPLDREPDGRDAPQRKVFRLRPPPGNAPRYPTPETAVFGPLSWTFESASPPRPPSPARPPAVAAASLPSQPAEPVLVRTQLMPRAEWTRDDRAPLTRLITQSTAGMPLSSKGEPKPSDIRAPSAQKPGAEPWSVLAERLSHLANSLETHEDRALFLRVLDAFEVSLQSLASLRDGQNAAADELGVRAVGDADGPFRRGRTGTDILNYLLAGDGGAVPARSRSHELAGFYADILFQQIAFMNAVREGVDALVTHLDPGGSFADEGRGRLLGGPTLKKYETFFRESTEDPWPIVFGHEFAEAYAEAMHAATGSRPMPTPSVLVQHLATRARLTVTSSELNGQEILLPQAGGTIGRTDDNDIVLAHASVSRRHARVFREKDRWFLEDAESSNGLTVNGERYNRTDLKAGDVVQLGKIVLRFDQGDPV